MTRNDFRDEWRERLRGQPYPLLATRQAEGLHVLSGAALWNRAIDCVRLWRRAGAAPGDLLIDSPEGIGGAWKDPSGNWVTARDIEAWAEDKCAAEVVGISGNSARGLKLAIALPECASPSTLDWTGSLESVFHRRFGVPVTLRACVMTPAYREFLQSTRAKSTSDALVKCMFPVIAD